LGAVLVVSGRDVAGSILFCLALNFKQMALYYSPVFFFVILRKCIDRDTVLGFCSHLVRVGATVVATFAILWLPFCLWPCEGGTCVDAMGQVLQRLFPFSRGIFEDKVANLWYAASVVLDFRTFLKTDDLATLSLALTLLLLAPICFNLMTVRITGHRVCLALATSSLAFFLASFQVHEKSLVLTLLLYLRTTVFLGMNQ
jgi:alpha-1,3-glucosyltransferase